MDVPLLGNRTGWTGEYFCAAIGGTVSNALTMVMTAMVTTTLTTEAYCEHHRASWIFTCLSFATTGCFAYQRFKHQLGKAESPHACLNSTFLMMNVALSIASFSLSIFGETCTS